MPWKTLRLPLLIVLFAECGCSQSRDYPVPDRVTATTRPVPHICFLGIADRGSRVVFLIDGGGFLLQEFDHLRVAFRSAVEPLLPDQSFNACFIGGSRQQWVNDRTLLLATPENKRRAYDRSDRFSSGGMTDVAGLFAKVLRQKPDVIYYVTDSGYVDENTIKDCRAAAHDTGMRLHIIAVVEQGFDPTKPDVFDLASLRSLAYQTVGTLRFVRVSEFPALVSLGTR